MIIHEFLLSLFDTSVIFWLKLRISKSIGAHYSRALLISSSLLSFTSLNLWAWSFSSLWRKLDHWVVKFVKRFWFSYSRSLSFRVACIWIEICFWNEVLKWNKLTLTKLRTQFWILQLILDCEVLLNWALFVCLHFLNFCWSS